MPKKKQTQYNNAVIYARFSSSRQREESIEQQIAECKEYAFANGIQIIDVYADSAKSGKTTTRSQYQRLRRDAQKGKFECVIAYKSSRIGRNMLNALKFENEMDCYGIKVLYAKEEFGDNAAGRFALRTMMNVNQFFSENMGEDIKRNQADNAMNCRANGPAPYGYVSGDDGKFVIDEDKAPIVREIFTRIAEGEPFVDIASDFNHRGIKTRQGNEWGKSSFASIIHNERYIGYYIYGDVRIEGGMPEIISKELFYKVQNRLKSKKNPQGRHRENGDYLLTGKLYCGKCGSHMIGMCGTSKTGAMHYYYSCNDKRTGGNCTKKSIRRDYIEREIVRGIQLYILQDDTIEWIADQIEAYQKESRDNPELNLLKDQLAETEKSIKNMLHAMDQGIITTSTRQHLLDLEADRSKISSQIALINSTIMNVPRENIIEWFEELRQGNVNDKDYQKILINNFLIKAYLFDDGRVKLMFDVFGGASRTIDIDADTEAEFETISADSEVEKSSIKVCSGSKKPPNREAFLTRADARAKPHLAPQAGACRSSERSEELPSISRT